MIENLQELVRVDDLNTKLSTLSSSGYKVVSVIRQSQIQEDDIYRIFYMKDTEVLKVNIV